ncbi:hypothetical protein, partial [Methylobacterium crusticola]|uniref:hypothetical protein n=1 Tax=Methylobacterium crusticola TaxID=1697972 RepID=UPI001EE2F834
FDKDNPELETDLAPIGESEGEPLLARVSETPEGVLNLDGMDGGNKAQFRREGSTLTLTLRLRTRRDRAPHADVAAAFELS